MTTVAPTLVSRARTTLGRDVFYFPTAADIASFGAGPYKATITVVHRDGTVDLLLNLPSGAGAPGTAVATAVADVAAVASADVAAVASANSAATAVADADATYGQPEADLINDIKAKYNAAVTLLNEIKTVQNTDRTLVNEIKSVQNLDRALVNDIKAKYNAAVAAINALGLVSGVQIKTSVKLGSTPGTYFYA